MAVRYTRGSSVPSLYDEDEGFDLDSPLSAQASYDSGWYGRSRGGKGSGSNTFVRCHESHKELQIAGGTLLGASCNYPRSGFDIYVGFDYGMKIPTPPSPWNPSEDAATDNAIHAKFEIADMRVPKDVEEFRRMVTWLIEQLGEGKRIHIGCIGGHGRTGLVMAAIVAQALGEKDAIQWVRQHHCKKAVETKEQVEFLMNHFGVSEAAPTKNLTPWRSEDFYGKYGKKGNGYVSGGKESSGKGRAIKSDEFVGKSSTRGAVGRLFNPLKTASTLFPDD